MNSSVATLITVALVAFTLLMLTFAIRGLRKETRLNLRTVLIGAAVPLASTTAYLAFSGTGQVVGAVAALTIGVVVGLGLAWLTAIEHGPTGIMVRQSGLTLIIWSVVYAATSLAGLFVTAQVSQWTVPGLAVAAGMAVGSQLGLLVRSRSRSRSARAQ